MFGISQFALVHQVILPVLLSLVFFVLILNKEKLKEKFKNSEYKELGQFFLRASEIKFSDLRKSLFIPVVSTFALVLFLVFAFELPFGGSGPLILELMSLTTAPFAEEFIFRGMMFSFVFLAVETYELKKEKLGKYGKFFVYSVSVLLISYIFAVVHLNVFSYQFYSRFVSSVLFSVLYLYSDRNLLAPVSAHFVWNFLNFVGV